MMDFSVANESSIASPALLVFREKVEANLARMIGIAGGPERLRPHVKTHKLAPLVAAQIALGISKFKTATLAEARMCAEAGAADVLVAYPLAGPSITGLCELARQFPSTRFSALADSPQAIRGMSVAARVAGIKLPVFLDIDCGMGRTGVMPEKAAVLYRLIAETPALIPAGLHAYDGHIHDSSLEARRAACDEAFAPVCALRGELQSAGLAVPSLIAGGSPTFPIHAAHPDRECSPGTGVLWDWGYAERYTEQPFEIAACVLTRVVSKPGRDRITIDLGYKAVASENPLGTRVRIAELPDAVAIMHSEEHMVLETMQAKNCHIGQTLHALPRHICPTVALYNEVWNVEGGFAREQWRTARGRQGGRAVSSKQ
jgi:D-serine deaminase-like pyridoxal phosphate-dependent protein